jgi:hypothetical protein
MCDLAVFLLQVFLCLLVASSSMVLERRDVEVHQQPPWFWACGMKLD